MPKQKPNPLTPTTKTTPPRRTLDATLLSWMKKLQPPNREDCRNGPRPCPHLHCMYHLYYQTEDNQGTLKLALPTGEAWELKETCALDCQEREQRQTLNSKPTLLGHKPIPLQVSQVEVEVSLHRQPKKVAATP